MRILFLLAFLFNCPFGIVAQVSEEPIGKGEKSCGFDEHHTYLMNTNPDYKTRFIHQKAILDSLKRTPRIMSRQHPTIYTIPVVVHVIHLGEHIGYNTNIPDEQIYDAINGLNERYANGNGAGADTEINFCLANRDPNGCPASGIVRVDGSGVAFYREEGITWDGSCGASEHDIKDLSKWPTGEYYNIWVVHDICGEVAGYAYYPNGDEYDGTVIDISSMNYESGTLAHELGHGLNLIHTFSGDDDGDCPPNDDCMEDGDEICDTPPHRRGNCGTNNTCSSEGIWTNSQNNWMSYCHPDLGIGLFTEDQRTRMHDAISVDPRAALLNSQGCANEVNMMITSDGDILCPYETRVLTAVPEGGYFTIASGSGYIEGNILTATRGSQVVVEYIIDQDTCTSSVYQDIAIQAVPNARLESAEDTLCIGQTTTLQGFPTGGTYAVISGPGSIDSNLLMAEDAGIITLLYEKLQWGCIIRDTHIVESFSFPVANVELLASDILTAIPDTGTFQWVRCDLDYEVIPNAVQAIYSVSTSGTYAVVAINGICRDTSECIEVEVTATQEGNSNPALKIYPNPANEVIYLEGSLLQKEFKMTLLDIRGMPLTAKIHKGQDRIQVDLSALLTGFYVLQVDIDGVGRLVFRVVKL